MTAPEAGFLLLTSTLGDPGRKVLTDAQLRTLTKRVAQHHDRMADRELETQDLVLLGYSHKEAQRIMHLLSQQDALVWYLNQAKKKDVFPITRVSECYPATLRRKLGNDCPGCLWAKGDVTLLSTPMVALVGSRELRAENGAFARKVGTQAALQGYTLVSGNARGADRQAQDACLQAGGRVVCVVADSLMDHPLQQNVLYLSESGFDLPFSSQRALHRNRVVHALADKVFVAECTYEKGGTWNGTVYNLRHSHTPVYLYADGSKAYEALVQLGGVPVNTEDLQDISKLTDGQITIW